MKSSRTVLRCAILAVPGGLGLHYFGVGGGLAGALLAEIVAEAWGMPARRRFVRRSRSFVAAFFRPMSSGARRQQTTVDAAVSQTEGPDEAALERVA